MFIYTIQRGVGTGGLLQVNLDMEGANTINRAVVMGEFTSDLHGDRKKLEISNVQTAKVNTGKTEDKAASDLLGHREVD